MRVPRCRSRRSTLAIAAVLTGVAVSFLWIPGGSTALLGGEPAAPEPAISAPAAPAPEAAPAAAPAVPAPAPAPAPAAAPGDVQRILTMSRTDEVRASHILVSSEEEATLLRKEIVAGGGDYKTFCAAARKSSKDVATKLLCGDVGWFTTNSGFERAFADAAFQLKPQELSEPVKTSFGWHLIFLTDRREKERPKPPAPVETGKEGAPAETTPAAGPNDLAPAAPTPEPKVEGKRFVAPRQPSFKLSILTTKSQRLQMQQFSYLPDQAVELVMSLTNEGASAESFFARELLPLGLKVTAVQDGTQLTGDYAAVAEPASFISPVKPYEVSGYIFSLNDYFKDLAMRRYRITWDVVTFLTNLEARFPKVKDLPDYAPLSEKLRKSPSSVQTDVITRDNGYRFRSRDLGISIFEDFKTDRKYYAQIFLRGEAQPVTIALNFQAQAMAARHFAYLVLEGFYDGLDFFDVEPNDFALGGDPLRTGTGAPSGTLPLLRNVAKLPHNEGTVSFISRSVRRGPAGGGQVGSIFVVCLKAHPEWDDEHVPFGEVVAGMDILKKLTAEKAFERITILSEEQYKGAAPATGLTTTTGNPEILIKTTKGNMVVELFEDTARNTAINFVRLAMDGFYNKDSSGGKQKFFFAMKDAAGKPLLIQGGSPTNDFDGGPGYSIRSEASGKPCVRGSLVMAVRADAATQKYVPDTAESQFFICLQDIPAYSYEKALTVFGEVKSGLDVLDKLAEGDTIESVEVQRKKSHPYTVQKITR